MIREPRASIFDLAACLSRALDLVTRVLVDHHRRVAHMAVSIGQTVGLTGEELAHLAVAALVHDSGALSLGERLDNLEFELKDAHGHAQRGWKLLSASPYLVPSARLVRHHHVPWDGGAGLEFGGNEVDPASHILHLSDRVDVLVDRNRHILDQRDEIIGRIRGHAGTTFDPRLVEALEALAVAEAFWLDLEPLDGSPPPGPPVADVEFGPARLRDLARVFQRVIDFRSPFTATHSAGVAATAAELGRLAGMSSRECGVMRVAGHMHDLGKLAVPAEILEKQGALTPAERNIIRSHTFYTYRVLEPLRDLDQVATWGAFHHERLDGQGYPFRHHGRDLSLGSRIMAVADVFTALTEDRPYRDGMDSGQALAILDRMARDEALDGELVALAGRHAGDIEAVRREAEAASAGEYERFSGADGDQGGGGGM